MVTNYVLEEEIQILTFTDNIDRRDGQKLWILIQFGMGMRPGHPG